MMLVLLLLAGTGAAIAAARWRNVREKRAAENRRRARNLNLARARQIAETRRRLTEGGLEARRALIRAAIESLPPSDRPFS
ncbi:hypothetical protein [Curtobacterium sp. GD1]|uniref:hypothetical protein n=1 Tax=Curtobacterium sp. GD1 TaxID=2810612 RepID=UPI001E57C031|nr:hypothetical protein [Curtobacterium sp. GD1]MCC8907752.1 hypothetical protein [Curtobacterium sp. GD1]